jgi:hypothetical protein
MHLVLHPCMRSRTAYIMCCLLLRNKAAVYRLLITASWMLLVSAYLPTPAIAGHTAASVLRHLLRDGARLGAHARWQGGFCYSRDHEPHAYPLQCVVMCFSSGHPNADPGIQSFTVLQEAHGFLNVHFACTTNKVGLYKPGSCWVLACPRKIGPLPVMNGRSNDVLSECHFISRKGPFLELYERFGGVILKVCSPIPILYSI